MHCSEVMKMLQLCAIWRPMAFIFVYNALQLTNVAWMDFLEQGLYFAAWEIRLVSIIGTIVALLGMWTY
jgi:hypothetical protein